MVARIDAGENFLRFIGQRCAGNHRDAWVYGAVDPNSGTASMLETVHGFGELLKSGWKPKRTIVIGSWDAEEEGLIGSTEWGEDHAQDLTNAAAYFNMDVAVAGKKFGASGTPSLKQFIREIAKAVPSPQGGRVFDDPFHRQLSGLASAVGAGLVTLSSGTFTVASGKTLTASSNMSITGGTLAGAGTTSGNVSISSGAINLTNPGSIGGTLTATGGSWSGNGSVTGYGRGRVAGFGATMP